MRQITERIVYLQKAINTLQAYRKAGDFSKIRESEIIISICEYREELENLLKIKKANRSLF